MNRFVMLIVSGCLISGAAEAQTTARPETQVINACVEAAAEIGNGCVGMVADPCIEKASKTNNFDADSKKCAERELAVWSHLMAKAIADINKNGSAKHKAATTSAQKSWEESVKALCPAFDQIDPGMAPGGSAYCRLHETGHRALMLRKLADATGEH